VERITGAHDRTGTYRRFLDAASRRSVVEAKRLCAPDVVLVTPLIQAWGTHVLHGHEGIEEWIKRMDGEWAFLHAQPVSAEEVRGCCRVHGRGKASSSEIEFELHHAVRFDGPAIAEFHAFLTADGARAKLPTR
jgi:hypothetical protein